MRTVVLFTSIALHGCAQGPEPDDGVNDSDAVEASDPPGRDTSPGESGHSDPPHTDDPPGPDLLAGPRFAGGARLQVDVWDVPGGHDVLAGLFDRDLGVPCRVDVASDGVLRCLPTPGSVVTYYTDSDCKTPVHALPAGACVDSPYLWQAGDARPVCGRGPSQTVFTWTPTDTPDVLYGGVPCRTVAVPQGATFVAHDPIVDVPVPPSTFVAFTRVDARVPGGLGVRFLVGDDGTVLAEALLDAAGACRPEGAEGALRCVPEERADRSQRGPFGQSDCTVPLAADGRGRVCATPRVVVEAVLEDEVALYGVGVAWPGDTWKQQGAQCVDLLPGDDVLYRVGAALDLASFPAVEVEVAGTGALRVHAWADAGTALLPTSEEPFELSASGERCTAVPLADGRVVCLPGDARRLDAGNTFFADDACQVSVFQASVDDPYGWVRGQRACGGGGNAVASAWTFGDRVQGQLYQGAPGVACFPAFHTDQFPGISWRSGTSADPPTIWPELVRAPR